jgi:spermidine/putrescine transport system ATP-binding protein
MQGELKRLQHETGITFVFVTHDQEEALTMSDRIAVMQAGRILQLGTPEEIYNAPVDRFVADFIGETNFLTLSVASAPSGEALTVHLPGGATAAARLPAGFSAAAGDRVTAVIRPEQIELAEDAPADLTGRVEGDTFFGTDTHLHLRLEDGQGIVLRRQNRPGRPGPPHGATVGLRLAPGALRVLPE